MINGKVILVYPHIILNRKFECTMINGKAIAAECTIINRKYLLRGGVFSHE